MPDPDGLTFPFPDPPAPGASVEVEPGVHWLRLPLDGALNHVNVYALDDRLHGGAGWTLVDTGIDIPAHRAAWEDALAGPLAGAPVARVIVTHHHPDHVGLAAWLTRDGAPLCMTRTAYLLARALTLDVHDRPPAAQIAYWRRAGLSEADIAARAAHRPSNFADTVGRLPPTYLRIRDGESLCLAGRLWTVRTGDGHAPDQATFWSQDGRLVLGADQLLPGISANLGAWVTEPDADPVAEWLESCARLEPHATPAQLVLPGHKLPYRGLPARLKAMQAGHHAALERLLEALADGPHDALSLFPALFGRRVHAGEFALALAETLGHLNHLHRRGAVVRTEGPRGEWLWVRTPEAG